MTGEYANVGVVLYAPAAKTIRAKCTSYFGRLSRMFVRVEGEHIKGLLRYVENRVNEAGDRLRNEELTCELAAEMKAELQTG